MVVLAKCFWRGDDGDGEDEAGGSGDIVAVGDGVDDLVRGIGDSSGGVGCGEAGSVAGAKVLCDNCAPCRECGEKASFCTCGKKDGGDT